MYRRDAELVHPRDVAFRPGSRFLELVVRISSDADALVAFVAGQIFQSTLWSTILGIGAEISTIIG